MVSWSTVAVLALACVVYGAFCTAAARAFFRARADRAAYRTAGAWAACFGVTVVGSLMALDAQGVDAAAAFAACACLASFPLCLLLERRWRNRDMAAAVAYLQLHRPAPRPAEPAAAPGVGMGHRPRRHLRASRALLRPDAPRGGRAAPAHGGPHVR